MGLFSHLSESSIYFSFILGTNIITEEDVPIGRFCDFFVNYEDVYPEVLAIQFQKNKIFFYIEWKDIKEFSCKEIVIKSNSNIRKGRVFPKVAQSKVLTGLLANQFSGKTVDYPSVGKVILDRQIVDTHGKKVVRVNDLCFIKVGKKLRITHAAVGFKSMLRRLGMAPLFFFLGKVGNLFKMRMPLFLERDIAIDWKFVHAIPDQSVNKDVRLNVSSSDLKSIHPADLADILEDLNSLQRKVVFDDLDPELAAKTLSEVEQEKQLSLINQEVPENAALIVENMGPDDAADLLNELSDDKAHDIISLIKDGEQQEDIQELLEYSNDTAGGIMSNEVFQVYANDLKNSILDKIILDHDEYKSIYDIYVISEDETLLGTCSLKRLLTCRKNIVIKEVMNTSDIKSLAPSTPWKEIASFMSKYDLINVPIVNQQKQLLGIVSVDDILAWSLHEK